MPDLNKTQLSSIARVLRLGSAEVKCGQFWASIHSEFGIGRRVGGKLLLTALDRQSLKELSQKWSGLDLLKDSLTGSRMDLAGRGATNEKLGKERPLRNRVVCTSLGAPIYFEGREMEAVPGVEYRLDYRGVDFSRYWAVLVIENHEVFVAAEKIIWEHQSVLVLYRGHDDSAAATNSCLSCLPKSVRVIIFSDPDPAGLTIINSYGPATHALVPCSEFFVSGNTPTNINRFASQQSSRPNLDPLLSEGGSLSPEYRDYVALILDGLAFTQEFLVDSGVQMLCISLRPS